MIISIITQQCEWWKLGLNEEVNVHKTEVSLVSEMIAFN